MKIKKEKVNFINYLFIDEYRQWYGDDDVLNMGFAGLSIGVVVYFFIALFFKKMFFVLTFGVSFYDSSSVFAEHLVHLYNTVWIILTFVVFFILALLVRIIYLFNWKSLYFTSGVYKIILDYVLEYFLAVSIFFNDKLTIGKFLKRINLIETLEIDDKNLGLNLWYNKNTWSFLQVSDISEYRLLEFLWCLMPIGSLLFISTPTFSLIFSLDACVDPVYTVKIIGRQWYWNYSFDLVLNNTLESSNDDNSKEFLNNIVESNKRFIPINSFDKYNINVSDKAVPVSFEFDSVMVNTEDLVEGTHRLLEVDNRLFLPVGVPVRLLITASDVLHSWAVPSLGIKVDAVPGRLNQFIVEIKRPGVFYGQCSELCGIYHGFMPIVIQAVSVEKFEQWLLSKVN